MSSSKLIGIRAAYRDELRAVFRQTLRQLENDDTGLF